MFRLLLIVLLLTAATARGEEIAVSLWRDGLPRGALAVVPDELDAPAPVVFVLHGVLETGPIIRAVTDRRFEALGAQHGWVTVYPSAFFGVWNIGEGRGAARLLPPRDDLGFLDAVLAAVDDEVEIDRDRVFVAGFSQGGLIGFSWACKRPGTVRAIAVGGMSLPTFFTDDCAAASVDGVQLAHGTRDPVVPFLGGPLLSGPMAFMDLIGHPASVDFFRRQAGCTYAAETMHHDRQNDRTAVIQRTWTECDGGAVEAWHIEGGGHRWPNGLPRTPFAAFVGPVTREFDGSVAAFAFFSRFR